MKKHDVIVINFNSSSLEDDLLEIVKKLDEGAEILRVDSVTSSTGSTCSSKGSLVYVLVRIV